MNESNSPIWKYEPDGIDPKPLKGFLYAVTMSAVIVGVPVFWYMVWRALA